jgi:hypothetical protein
MEIPKKESSFFFYFILFYSVTSLFCCKFFIFRYFHKFIFQYRPKKYFPVSAHKKSTPFEMLHRSPIEHAAAEREFLFAFFC